MCFLLASLQCRAAPSTGRWGEAVHRSTSVGPLLPTRPAPALALLASALCPGAQVFHHLYRSHHAASHGPARYHNGIVAEGQYADANMKGTYTLTCEVRHRLPSLSFFFFAESHCHSIFFSIQRKKGRGKNFFRTPAR